MKRISTIFFVSFGLTVISFAQSPSVISTLPVQNELNIPCNSSITVNFDIAMDETTINDSTFLVNARSTGLHLGTFTYIYQTNTVVWTPEIEFNVGEVVTVVLTTDIESINGVSLDKSYVLSFTVIVVHSSGTFSPQIVYTVDSSPITIFAADFDNDHDIDLATGHHTTDNVSILENYGDGTFSQHLTYNIGSNWPLSICAADFDKDGDLDLATANYYGYTASVLFNDGNGQFGTNSVFPIGMQAWGIFSADLDGDGDIDLATANMGSNDISVLLNNGDATFASHVDYSVGNSPRSVFAADLDNDYDLDLVVTNNDDNNVSILFNNGDAVFGPESLYAVGEGPERLFIADLDGDGDNDIVTSNFDSYNVVVLMNNGDGTFSSPTGYPNDSPPRSVFVADLDGDGDLDLATSNWNYQTASVFLNNGDGTFVARSSYPIGAASYSIFAADLDGDGALDLTATNRDNDNISVLLNQGATDVQNVTELHANEFSLKSCYPNPFNATTTIQYNLFMASVVTVEIYDIIGRKVETLVNEKKQAGYHQATWNAMDVSSGIYFYKIQAGDCTETRKMVLLK